MRPIPPPLMTLDDVTGIVVRGDWPHVEPAPAVYDFDYFERELDRVAKAGKFASLVITSGGRATPEWLHREEVQMISVTDPNPYHGVRGSKLEIPVFWDHRYLVHKLRLIQEMGRRFADRSRLVLVSAQCANATTDDWNVPATPAAIQAWHDAGFTEDKLVDACKTVLDATMKAFPKQAVRMAVGRVAKPLAADPDSTALRVIRYANRRYPGRFFAQRHNLGVATPSARAPELHGWRLLTEARPYVAAQFLWPATDSGTCRLAGGVKPCDPRAAFSQTVDRALTYDLHYVEVYAADLLAADLSPEVHRLSSALARMSESAPKPPPPSTPPSSVPRNHPVRQDVDLRGRMLRDSLVGSITGKTLEYSVYIPPGSGTKLPVVYWLHGRIHPQVELDAHRSTYIAAYLERAARAGTMPPSLVVFPDAGRSSFYSDSADGLWPIETMIVKELLPLIDATYPTAGTRASRVLMGFSMGGFGALKLAAKYSDLFVAVVAYGAPHLDARQGMGRQEQEVFQRVFGGDPRHLRENTAGHLFPLHRSAVLDSGLRVRLVAGGADGTRFSVIRLHQILTEQGIPHDYELLPGVTHAVGAYYDAEQGRGFAFLGRALGVNTP